MKAINQFLFGVCYYPEQWGEKYLEEDLKRIKEANMNVVRLGEFAWAKYEPEEGKFDFSFLKRAIEKSAEYDLKVVLGTPTATPPAWLTKKHPEVLRETFDGQTMHHGSRQQANHSSDVYRKYSKRIVRKMAEAVKGYDNLIGWQIDNEFHCHINLSYAESDLLKFRSWLKEKYGTLEKLNEAWGTVCWSQEYTAWEQVKYPQPTPTYNNPSKLLDYRRFISDTTIEYSKMQAKILKEVTPNKFITHNGVFDVLDYNKLVEESLDFLSYDSYPTFGEQKKNGLGRNWNRKLSEVRGYSSKFLVLEQQSGPGGQLGGADSYSLPTPEPGQIRLWTYQSLAHGAAGIFYFRWRTYNKGVEQTWYGILDHDNLANRRLEEVTKIGNELKEVGEIFQKAEVKNEIAVLADFDNQQNEKVESYLSDRSDLIYKVLDKNHMGADFIYDLKNIDQYEVIICSNLTIVNEEMIEKLEEYVRTGGRLIVSAHSGVKNKNNHYYRKQKPGLLRNLTGLTVEESISLPEEYEQKIEFNESQITPEQLVEVLNLEQAEAIASYKYRYYKGKPAAAVNQFGEGEVFYFGSYFNQESCEQFVNLIEDKLSCLLFADLPKEVEVSKLILNDDVYYMLLNYSDESVSLNLREDYLDLISGKKLNNNLEKYGVALLKA